MGCWLPPSLSSTLLLLLLQGTAAILFHSVQSSRFSWTSGIHHGHGHQVVASAINEDLSRRRDIYYSSIVKVVTLRGGGVADVDDDRDDDTNKSRRRRKRKRVVQVDDYRHLDQQLAKNLDKDEMIVDDLSKVSEELATQSRNEESEKRKRRRKIRTLLSSNIDKRDHSNVSNYDLMTDDITIPETGEGLDNDGGLAPTITSPDGSEVVEKMDIQATKKRKRKKKGSSNKYTIQDASGDDNDDDNEEKMSETAVDSATISINASVENSTEEIVLSEETIESSINEVDETLNAAPIEEEDVGEEPSDGEVVNRISGEVVPASDDDDEKSITFIDASPIGKEIDGEIDDIIAEEESKMDDELIVKPVENAVDVTKHAAIDATVEIPGEIIVPESIVASIEVEEILLPARSMDEIDFSLNMDNSLNNNEEKGDYAAEENDREDQGEESHEMIPERTSLDDTENSAIEEEGLAVKGTEDENIEERESDEKDDHGQSMASELSKTSIQSSDEDEILHPNHESEAEDIDPHEKEVTHEDRPSSEVNDCPTTQKDEENIVEKVLPAQDGESRGKDVSSNMETDGKTLQDPIELEKMEDDCLTLSVVTWNLGEASFSENEASFFKKFRKGESEIGSDLVLIGAQECEDIKPRRTEGHRSRHLRRVGIHMLGQDYVPLAIHSLGGIQMALYCHHDVLGDVEMVNIADVTCGVGNVFHNKGAIGVYVQMKRLSVKNGVAKTTRILFATGHLAAHVKNVDARNDDFKRIMSELEAQAPLCFLRPKRNPDGSPCECDGSHLLKSVDHVFFAGDLNYRIDLPREYVERCILDIKDNQLRERHEEADALMNKLLRRDQLLQTISSGRAFSQFNEGKITFLPTFKFDKGTQNYDTSHKQRVPAWTDRILFRSSKVNVLEYRSVPAAVHSDHRPVFGTYQLGWGTTTMETSRRGKRHKKKY